MSIHEEKRINIDGHTLAMVLQFSRRHNPVLVHLKTNVKPFYFPIDVFMDFMERK